MALKLQDCYVQTAEELLLFSSYTDSRSNFLAFDDIIKIFPDNVIVTHRFSYLGHWWRLVSRQSKDGFRAKLYLAVKEEVLSANWDASPRSSPTHMAKSYPDNMALAALGGHPHAHPLAHPLAHSSHPGGGAGYGGGYAVVSPPPPLLPDLPPMMDFHDWQELNKFSEDLKEATHKKDPMDRYKALIRLINYLRRQLATSGVVDPSDADCWAGARRQHLLKQIMMVGDSLAGFGTADFMDTSNSSRAITSRDYAQLLKLFLENNGIVFETSFIDKLEPKTQDEALTVRSLLATRCDANDLIFAQLIKHVGLENQRTGAMVYNTSVINANPTNINTASPSNVVHSTSSASAKLSQKGMGIIAVAVGLGLLLLKKQFFGGGGRSRGRGGAGSDDGGEHQRARRRSDRSSGNQDTERAAVRFLSSCTAELKKSTQNAELLENDWRLGKLRLASPGNPYPPGYEPVNSAYCTLEEFYRRLEGRAEASGPQAA